MDFFLSVLAIICVVTIHEFSHAWVAYVLGDPTARYMGRLTLNPFAHFDLFGTLAFIFTGFGWGKPVPFKPENLKYPRRDGFFIACAGPAANIVAILLIAIPLKYLGGTAIADTVLFDFLYQFLWWSAVLFCFNILPLPPLDGSKIIELFIPKRWCLAYQEYLTHGEKYVILFILFDVFVLYRLADFSVLNFAINGMAEWLLAVVSVGT